MFFLSVFEQTGVNMQKLAIFGADKMGKSTKKLVDLKYSNEYKLVYFVDNDTSKQGTLIESIPVISTEKLLELYKENSINCVAVCIVKPYGIEFLLTQHKIPLIRIESIGIFSLTTPSINNDSRPQLPQLETHISNHCNLKCKGCSHYSNTEKYPPFPTIDSFEKDIERLTQLFWNVEKFFLMGGEPFLNPELPKFMSLTRQYFPISNIQVISNGLLICKQNPNIWESFLKYDIGIEISSYPPTLKLLTNIESILKKYGVKYTIRPPITHFIAVLTKTTSNNPMKSRKVCLQNSCTIFLNGKIAKCPCILLADAINQYCSDFYSNQADIIDIHDASITGKDILEKISGPANFCKYCSESPRSFEWKSGGKVDSVDYSDWLA